MTAFSRFSPNMYDIESPIIEGSEKVCLVSRCANIYLTACSLHMDYSFYQIALQRNMLTQVWHGAVSTGYLSLGRRPGGD